MIPIGAASFSRALEVCVAMHAATGRELERRGLSTLKANEGGYGPQLVTHAEALELLERSGETEDAALGAAS